MTKRYTLLALLFFLTGAAFAAVPLTVEAATLYLSPSSGSYYEGENFKIHILVNSDVAINGVSGILNFSTRRIKAIDIDKGNSVLNFWIEEPSFSNAGALGNIRFEGVALNPGITGNNKNIATITFRADVQGTTDINFNQSAILANDGLGTNVGASVAGAHFTVLPQRASFTPIQNTTQTATQKPQVIFVRELAQETPSIILSFWKTMPEWVKISIAVFIGLATIIFSLIILSLGTIVLVWLWSNVWRRRYTFLVVFLLLVRACKNVVHTALSFFGMTKREIEGDVHYSVQRMAKELKEASIPLSFKILVKNYFSSIYDIVKRFLMKNTMEDTNEHTHNQFDKDVQSDNSNK